MTVNEKLKNLRKLMKENKLDAYIVPSSDSHLSEYVAEHFKCRQWISGFTGSAGTAVITLDDAGLWTDGRYYIQAEKQLQGSGIRLFKMAFPGVPSYTDWLKDVLKKGNSIGFDGNVFSASMVSTMDKEFKSKEIKMVMNLDLIGELWSDRPELPDSPIFIHDVKYAGKSRTEKLNEVRNEIKSNGANYYLLSSLDDIAWLLNIRGADVPNNPVIISNVVVSKDKCFLFIDASKVTSDVRNELESDNIDLKNYNEIYKFLEKLTSKDTIMLDINMTNACLYNSINKSASKLECANVTTKLKAIKNSTEIENLKQCQISDGVAMVRFIKWLKTSLQKEKITELSLNEKLESFRKQDSLCVGPSFDTIAGYKEHAAMMHYKATSESQYTLKDEGFLLVDSGGQYFNGTTDITRTIVLGKLTEEEKRDFTLVLKSNIALATLKFLHGATGSSVDIVARQPIWKHGLDYKCGTGHGVGFFLNVHEGPQRISTAPNNVILKEGMIVTNEPGIYKEGKHGIRTENMMLVKKDESTEFGQFMKFEAITYCPIDVNGIVKNMLTEDELDYINTYNNDVYTKLSPYLSEDEKAWLKEETREV